MCSPCFIVPGMSSETALTKTESCVDPNRSRAIQDAVADKLQRVDRGRLARECAKLDRTFEQAMAEEGIGAEVEQWPEY